MRSVIGKVLLILLFLFWQAVFSVWAAPADDETDKILSSAESLFKAMKRGDYPGIWILLSEKSKTLVIDDVYKAVRKENPHLERSEVDKDFASGGVFSSSYWKSYVGVFDPTWVLEESRWEMGNVGKGKAEIIIHYKKAQAPARLKMFNENGQWKVGLEETFRASRR